MDNLKFDTRWFKNLNEEEREKLKSQLLGDKKTLDKLKEIVYNIVKNETDVRVKDYSSPSWLAEQAHRNGRVDAFRSILSLIELDKETDE